MKVLKMAAVLPLLGTLCGAGAAEPSSAFRPREVLTEAHYIQEGIIPLEQEFQRLSGNPTAEEVGAAINGFEAACRNLDIFWQNKGVPILLDTALTSVRNGQVLEQAQASLAQGQLPAARDAARGAYEAVLTIAYAALAEDYSAVAEQNDKLWSLNAWLELANVRLKQRELRLAKEALWQAHASASLGDPEMEPIRKALETLAERIGRGLMSRGDYETAKDHFSKYLAATELQQTEFVRTALGMSCFELGDMDCAREQLQQAAQAGTGNAARDVLARAVRLLQEAAADPALYARLFQLVEIWREIAPEDQEILKIPAAAAQQDATALLGWLQQTADCGIKAQVVRGLQQAAPAEPYLTEAEVALACDAANAVAQTAVTTANYRLAVRAWNELAQHPPAGSAAAAPKIENLRALLSRAAGNEDAAALALKVEDYAGKLDEKDRQEAANRKADLEEQCMSLLKSARWARDQDRIGLADLADIVERTKEKSAGCAKHLDEAGSAELEQLQPALAARLQKDCEAEYYRLPDLPSDPSSLRPDQLEMLRPHFEAYHHACGPFIANTFRAEKVDSVMKRLAAPSATP